MLPADFWATEQQHLRSVLQPHLVRMALFGVFEAEKKLAQFGISFDNALAHADAAGWARQYTDTILQQFGTTTEKGVGEIIASFAETPGMTMADLNRQLLDVLDRNQVRAHRVAVTEATRAFASGNNVAYQRAGLPAMAVHAPAHVNCRCGERVVRLGDEWVIVWATNRDDLVCKRTLRMPWGEVKGCRDLHNRIISVGPYLGQKLSDIRIQKLHKVWDEGKHPRDKGGEFTSGQAETGKDSATEKQKPRPEHYENSVDNLTEDYHWTEINGIRITGERRRHWRERHSDITDADERDVLPRALTKPTYSYPDPDDKNVVVNYLKDDRGRWWKAPVATDDKGDRFVMTFHRDKVSKKRQKEWGIS